MDFSLIYGYLSPEIATFIVSMLPVAELRVSIPLAIGVYEMSPFNSFIISIAGNILPVIFLLFFLEKISTYLSKKSTLMKKFFSYLFRRTRDKNLKKFEKWGDLALILFVAIPLPVTGGWSGAVAAFVFGVSKLKAIALIFSGIVIAGILVTLLTLKIL